jgi:hypothetical protein
MDDDRGLNAGRVSDCCAGERVVHRQLAEPGDARRQAHGSAAARRRQAQGEPHPLEPARSKIVCAHVGIVAEAVGEHPRSGALGHPSDAAVVLVEHGDRTILGAVGAMLFGSLAIYAVGVPWLAYVAYGGDLNTAYHQGMETFLLWDALKLALAAAAFPAAWWFVGRRPGDR